MTKKQLKQLHRKQAKAQKKERAKAKRQFQRERIALKSATKRKELTDYYQKQLNARNLDKPPASTTTIHETLEFIRRNKSLNVNLKLSTWLKMALRKETNDLKFKFEPGEHEYYTLDDTWDGRDASVISHITINKEFTDATAKKYIEAITESEWGSKERHDAYIEDAKRRAYHTLNGLEYTGQQLEMLENIMYSSAVWHIVGDQYGLTTGDYDSDQAKENWNTLHESVKELSSFDGAQGDLAEVMRRIEGYDKKRASTAAEYNDVLNLVETKLRKYRGEKYEGR